jgi:2-polyprenyl-3-methyl-5-hydroxy-6-metoxy-1,4-benzoquinol methylase
MLTPLHDCPICQKNTHVGYLWNTSILYCKDCEFGFVEHLPEIVKLQELYSASYFNGRDYIDYLRDKVGIQINFRNRIKDIRAYCADGALFEAGCAYGLFLQLAQEFWEVQGIDISKEAVIYARDQLHLSVRCGDLESNPPPACMFDVIAMWDTIEHLYDPVFAIRKCAEGLREGGILALTTGDICAFVPNLQKHKWRMIIPAHLHFFSQKSIKKLLALHGLEVLHFSHVGYYRSLRQMAQVIIWRHENSAWRHFLLEQIDRLPLNGRYFHLNLFDIMFVIAKKIDHRPML